MGNTFVNCFKIAKKNKGVLYWRFNGSFAYSPVKDLHGEPIIDFRTDGVKHGKELNKEDRESFYKVTQ